MIRLENILQGIRDNLTAYLSKRSKLFFIVSGCTLVIILGAIDYLTEDFSLFIFYLAPVFMVTWYAGMRVGNFISIVTVVSWLFLDVITTPYHSHPLVHLWNTIIEFAFLVAVTYVVTALKNTLLREKELARIDYVTGAVNVRAFSESAHAELERARRYKRAFAMAYLDLDNFKEINDNFGHSIGNAVLRVVVETIKHNIRVIDIVARLGGDEFAILLPETGYEPARIVVSRIKDMLSVAMKKSGWPVTFSIGVAVYMSPPGSVDEMIKKADALMYSAKGSGKDTIKYDEFPKAA